MTVKLSDDLAEALAENSGIPVRAIHPTTNKVYFLVSEESYDRLKPLFEEEPLSLSEQLKLIEQAGKRAGWDDPEMDAYDRYDQHQK
jgi:hypothetical protein